MFDDHLVIPLQREALIAAPRRLSLKQAIAS